MPTQHVLLLLPLSESALLSESSLSESPAQETQYPSASVVTPGHGAKSALEQLEQPDRLISHESDDEPHWDSYVAASRPDSVKALTAHTSSAARQPPMPSRYCTWRHQ